MGKRFRIALSYSGKKRDFVSRVADGLANRFGQERILYDKFHEGEFARSDLGFHLPALYHDESDLIVVVFCKDYDASDWCGVEWSAIFGLIKNRKQASVMLCRFDHVEVPGLYGLEGFVELDEKVPDELVALIGQRLAVNDGRPGDDERGDASGRPQWPAEAPSLEWPVADHTEARRAFAELITRTARGRVLPICGSSETGKSHLSNQFLRNALQIPDLMCGRFDFKGSSDMDAELGALAENLGVPIPTANSGVSRQLAQIFAHVKAAARPTLLIFDTFELAGEAERWIKNNLLLSVVAANWLRVIIVGQRVPTPYGEPWEGASFPPIELRPPTPEDWFDFGKSVNTMPEFTLDHVRVFHKLVNGSSSVIAQMCRPPVRRDGLR